MSFFEGFCDELEKIGRYTPPKVDFGKKKTFVPGMTQKEVRKSNTANRAPAPKVQRMTFKPTPAKAPVAGSLKGKRAFAPKKDSKPDIPGLDNLFKGIK